ncbi:MAG: methyltransferase domain-containing protein [Candidatus Hydrogenedentes bacterium]|nr:methyltransferase domain-containing protein [Candidatus Hydrogenedentota bacterium]
MSGEYVHGYTAREAYRLVDQATTLTDLLHCDTAYSAGESVLEAGCGVGAQTVTLAKNSPNALITSLEISEESLEIARERVTSAGITNVTFRQGDIFNLPEDLGPFDHIFVCFVLEHLSNPVGALACLKQVLKPGGTMTVVEGDHGSVFFHPDSIYAHKAIDCQIALQARGGGNACIGRQLYPLLEQAGFSNITVSPRTVYVDSSRPALVEGFTKKTFTAMVEGVREQALAQGLINEQDWERGIRDLYRTAERDGTFNYMFFKAIARMC